MGCRGDHNGGYASATFDDSGLPFPEQTRLPRHADGGDMLRTAHVMQRRIDLSQSAI
jgi:hypothetical protein